MIFAGLNKQPLNDEPDMHALSTGMDEFGMGGQPRDHIIYSQEDRPLSASRSQGPGSVVASRQPSDTRPRSGSRSGNTPRPASGSAINAAVRQPTTRPHSGRRSSRPGSAEGTSHDTHTGTHARTHARTYATRARTH